MLHLVVFNTFSLAFSPSCACTHFYDGDGMFRESFSKQALLCVVIIALPPEGALHIHMLLDIPLIFIQEPSSKEKYA
jgi:hypothetical protein